MDLTALGNAIAAHLKQVTGLHTNVRLEGRAATLRGRVPSVEARQALLDLAAELAPRWQLVDELEFDVPVAESAPHGRIRELQYPTAIEPEQLEPAAGEPVSAHDALPEPAETPEAVWLEAAAEPSETLAQALEIARAGIRDVETPPVCSL